MCCQHGVRNIAVRNNLNGAIVRYQLLGRDDVRWMVVQMPVYAGDAFHVRANGAHIVRNQQDGHALVQFNQLLVQLAFELAVDVGIGLVENKNFGVRNKCPPQKRCAGASIIFGAITVLFCFCPKGKHRAGLAI